MDLRIGKACYKFLLFSMTAILILFLGVSAYAEDNTPKNILIINSYQKGLSWTDDETNGVLGVLENSGDKYSVAVEYMDWKNYSTKENLNYLKSYFKYKYSKKHIDLIITTDDAALEFALNNREDLFTNRPIVFCGVNENGERIITKGFSNVTGVLEKVDAEGTIKAALQINPNLKEIYVVFDNTESGLSTGDLTIQAVHKIAPTIKAIPVNEGEYRKISLKASQIKNDSIILITTYYIDEAGIVDGFQDFSQMISQKSQVPVFHLYDFGMGHGVIGGSMLSGRLQGEYAGKIAQRVLKGENISSIPVNSDKTTHYIFDYIQLERFNIPLDRVPKGSQLINKPFSFFETYKNLVVTVFIIFSSLVIFICILLSYLRKISKIKDELYQSHTKLAQLYEELTASDEELKQQFDELTVVQKSLVASDERYALLFEKMLNGFIVFETVLDKENKLIDLFLISVNPGFERHTNKKATDMPGRTWTEVFGYQNRNLAQYQKVLLNEEAVHFETYNPDSGVYYLINAFKINENQIGVVFDNITEYKNAIKEVQKLNEGLEQRVTERTNDLQFAISELEAFTYTVSHDLKAPLRAVDGYSKIILEDFGGELGQESNEMILNIRSICNEMIDMINKLLQYSITSRSALKIEEIDTEEMFLTIYKEIKATYRRLKIEMKIETGLPNVMGDRILLKQVIYNILSNAAKFTKDRENAQIIVGSALTENEYIFYIKDNGVGFDMNYSSKLFGIFQRLHTSDEFEGSGIGLVTIKKIIEKHGGRTWIEGEVDVGATVYFTLPFIL